MIIINIVSLFIWYNSSSGFTFLCPVSEISIAYFWMNDPRLAIVKIYSLNIIIQIFLPELID